jgi:hypothetical protein
MATLATQPIVFVNLAVNVVLSVVVVVTGGAALVNCVAPAGKMRGGTRRSLWLISLSNGFALFTSVVLVAIMNAKLLGSSADPPALELPVQLKVAAFWLSHLTPPLYALPYILRALRLAAMFEPRLRKTWGWTRKLW